MASINFNANKNSIEGKSHVILRTNPALTSNVKLVVDSAGEIYLDSINANKNLSDQRYKRFSLSKDGHFAYDIAAFYAGTPYETVYEPLRRDSDLSVYKQYHKQFEEQYNYGARLNGAKDFDENIRFMAPLWIDETLPEYFVIYRIEEPISKVALNDTLEGINGRIMQMLKSATIVKTFDLRKGSIIGDYLDRFANDDARPKAPLTVSFEKNEKSSWNGIDIRRGGFASKGEYIYDDFVGTDREEILNNKFITEGFKRSQLISANLINLEFLFEDFDTAYDVNRYIGVYVNAHEEGSFKAVKYQKNILTIDTDTVQTNFDLSGTPSLTDVDMLPYEELDFPVLQWVKSDKAFYNVLNENTRVSIYKANDLDLTGAAETIVSSNTIDVWDIDVTGDVVIGSYLISATPGEYVEIIGATYDAGYQITTITASGNINSLYEIGSNPVSIKYYTYEGYKSNKLPVSNFTISPNKFRLKEDTLRITNILEDARDFINIKLLNNPQAAEEIIIATYTEYLIAANNGDALYYKLTANSALAAGEFTKNSFSNQGSLKDVTRAIKGALGLFEDLELNVSINGANILIENYMAGNRTKAFFVSTDNTFNSFEVNGVVHTNELDLDTSILNNFTTYLPKGGSYAGFGFLIDATELDDIDTTTYIKSNNNFIRIVEIVEDPAFANYYRVCLDGKINNLKLVDNSINLWVENTISFGKFEALDFYDFDYNFYSTANSNLGELEYESYLIKTNNASQSITLSDDFITLEGIKQSITPTSTGKTFILNEYERLQENYNKNLALESRVVPTINKWRYFEGVNAKEMPYMLSVSEAFGKTNFSPDITKVGRDINGMTHEWFYLYKHPKYLVDDGTGTFVDMSISETAEMVTKLTSYIQPEDSINLDYNKLIDVNNDWFDRLFIYDGYDVAGIGFAPAGPATKYVRLRGGSTEAPAEALFRGLKVKLYERKEFNESNPKNLQTSTQFNDYKFTAVLNYNYNQNEDSVTIKAVQNKAFNFVCLYIEVNTSGELVETVNRKVLYSLRDFFDNPAAPDTPGVVDTVITGYIDFSISQTGSGNYLLGQGVNTNLLRDIQLNPSGSFNNLLFTFNNDTWVLPVNEIYPDQTISIKTDANGNISNVGETNTMDITLLTTANWANIIFTYEEGGYNLAKSLFESISANAIAQLLNNNDTETIQYVTVETDGTVNTNRFIINIEDGNEIAKPSTLTTVPDPDKPNSYKVAAGSIGYITQDRVDRYTANLIRMSGHYTPLARPVVSFTDLYSEYKTTQMADDGDEATQPDLRQEILYNRYNRMGIAFMSYINRGQYKYGLIEDMFYHKVNPEKADGILKLSNTTGSQPRYPLINEVAIDKRDINVFRSSWEDQFYTKNGSNKQDINVYGTLSTHEESAFLASTLNLPKNQYEVTAYSNIMEATSLSHMRSIRLAGYFTGDIVKFEDAQNIYMDIYMSNILVNLLEADNAGYSITKFVQASQSYGDKTTVADDIREYIRVNLLKLMNIADIKVYNRDNKLISKSEVLSADSFDEILNSGITESKDFRIEYDNTNPLNIKLIYNKRVGFKHQLYIYTKIRS